ncbi:MAG: hypothetical protein WC895_05080, partial [Candidatus Shapirobacteria bacterium]
EVSIAVIGGIFGLDAARSVVFTQFLYGAILFLVMTGCFYAMTKRFWWSLVGVSIYLFAGFLFSGPWVVFDLFKVPTGGFEFLTFVRPVSPLVSAPLFYGSLWGFIVWIRTRSRKGLVVAGALMACAFYSYVYAWSLLGAFYAMIGIGYVVKRDWNRVKDLAWLAGGLFVV